MKVAIGAGGDGDALGADDREGRDGQRALGHGGGGVGARGRAGRAEGDRDRYAVDRSGERAAREGDRVGDGVRAVVDEGVRAGDVVDAGDAGVLGDRAGRGVGGWVAPVDRRGEVAGGEAAWRRAGSGIGAVKVPTIALTFWKPSTLLIVTAGPGVITSGLDVGDVDLLVVDRIDDARAGDRDEHFAGKQARRDGRAFRRRRRNSAC